jgi:hypothetical protein
VLLVLTAARQTPAQLGENGASRGNGSSNPRILPDARGKRSIAARRGELKRDAKHVIPRQDLHDAQDLQDERRKHQRFFVSLILKNPVYPVCFFGF